MKIHETYSYGNSYVGRSHWLLEYQNILRHCRKYLGVLHNYFDSPTKLSSDLYPAKFLDTPTKPFHVEILNAYLNFLKYIIPIPDNDYII